MKEKHVLAFMKVAEVFADLSTARRLQVGAIVVKDQRIISIGYNGTPTGWSNECEEYYTMIGENGERFIESKTRPEVLHAEMNAITKLAKSPESSEGSVMFTTHAPCLDCAKAIYQSGIRSVIYKNEYRSDDGISFLNTCGVVVEKMGETYGSN